MKIEYIKDTRIAFVFMLVLVLSSCNNEDNDLTFDYWQYEDLVGKWVPESNGANWYLDFLPNRNVAGQINSGNRVTTICGEAQQNKDNKKTIVLTKTESSDGGKLSDVIFNFEWIGQNKDAIMLSGEKWIKVSDELNPYWTIRILQVNG